MPHEHNIIDNEPVFTIDKDSRTISGDDANEVKLVQYDHNSERITFTMLRFKDGHDYSKCDVVQIHYSNIGTGTSASNRPTSDNIYDVKDLKVDPDDDKYVTFSWLISRMATQFAGTVEFSVKFACKNEAGDDEEWSWNTDIFSFIRVSKGKNNSSAIVIKYTDDYILWKFEVNELVSSAIDTANSASDIANEAMEIANESVDIASTDRKTFRTKADMDAWIASKKLTSEEMTIPNGTFVNAGDRICVSMDLELVTVTIDGVEQQVIANHPTNVPTVYDISGAPMEVSWIDFYAENSRYVISTEPLEYGFEIGDIDVSNVGFAFNGDGSTDGSTDGKNIRVAVYNGDSAADFSYDHIKTHHIALGTKFYIEEPNFIEYWWNGIASVPKPSSCGQKTDGGEIFNDYTDNKAGYKAHVEGQKNTGTGDSCHVEGASNIVTAGTGHAEGRQNNVDAPNGHAEGQGNIITKGAWSGHIEGQGGEVHGHTAHGGGFKCKVYARHGFAHGLWLIAGDVDNANDLSIALAQSVFGRYNQPDLDALLMIGNGTGENKRRNAFVVYGDGHVYIHDDVYVHGGNDRLATADEVERGLQTILDALNAALGEEVTS